MGSEVGDKPSEGDAFLQGKQMWRDAFFYRCAVKQVVDVIE